MPPVVFEPATTEGERPLWLLVIICPKSLLTLVFLLTYCMER